jgi:hypothetical protein
MTMTPPELGPFEEPTICIEVNCSWMSFILGAVEKLAFPGWWDTSKVEAQDSVEAILGALSTGNCPSPEEYMYPESAFVPGLMAEAASGDVVSIYHDTQQNLAHFAYQTTPANGDSAQLRFFLASGNYYFRRAVIKNQYAAKIDWRLDGGSVFATDDLYAASQQNNVVISSELAVTTDGPHTLTLTVNGRNASAIDWFWYLIYIALEAAY